MNRLVRGMRSLELNSPGITALVSGKLPDRRNLRKVDATGDETLQG